MAKQKRKIIEINEELCNGCGQCVPSCAEGALAIIDGKAKVVKDMFCDGLGACLGDCPTGALKIVEREADPFDEEAAMEHVRRTREEKPSGGCPGSALHSFAPAGGACPGSALHAFVPEAQTASASDGPAEQNSLGHWPVKIRLVPAHAPFLNGANLVVAADCTAVAVKDFHDRFVPGNVVMIGCPKFDPDDYAAKFEELFSNANIKSVTVVRMEVPCCQGIVGAVRKGLEASGKRLPYQEIVVGRQGELS